MQINIPEDIEGSFYDGQLHVGVKENCFQPSSPLRHISELSQILEEGETNKEILCLYTVGGPDHRVTYLSLQMALICLLLRHDKDMLIAVRTPPHNSWKNPSERIMSILNQGLQCVGLMRQKCLEEIEKKMNNASSMKDIVRKRQRNTSIAPVKDERNFSSIEFKRHFFQNFDAVTEDEVVDLFSEMMKIDASVAKSDTTQQKVNGKAAFLQFLKTHCLQRQYTFSIKTCDDISCTVCLPPRLNNDVFSMLSHLPDPVPNGDHYKSFADIYGSMTSECHLPSLHEKEAKGHKILFNPSAKNTGILLICEECIKPRLIHSQRKLKADKII